MTDTVKSWIEERRTIHAKATEGPWDKRGSLAWEGSQFGASGTSLGQTWGVRWGEDQAAITDAHNMLPRALNALSKVLELHRRAVDIFEPSEFCAACSTDQRTVEWPCATIEAIEGAINE